MAYSIDAARSKRLERGGQVVGAVAVLVSDSGDPDVVLRFTREPGGAQTAAQFRTMLLGAGTVANPQGELGAWITKLNAAADDQVALT